MIRKWKIEANPIIFLVFFVCISNMLNVYGVTSAFDRLRVPLQLVAVVYCALSVMNVIKRGSIRVDLTGKGHIVSFVFLVYLALQVVLNTQNRNTLINDMSNAVFSIIVFLDMSLSSGKKFQRVSIGAVSEIFFALVSILYLWFRINPTANNSPTNIFHAQYVNSIYYVLFALPFVLESPRKLIYVGLSGLCVLLSAKQGAFLAYSFGLFGYWIVYSGNSQEKNGFFRKITVIFILLVVASYAYGYVVDRFNIDIMAGFSSIAEDGGNGRLDIYLNLINRIKQSSFMDLLIGHGGLNAVATDLGISAHNDVFETIYDFGLIGVMMYSAFVLHMVKVFFTLRKTQNQHYASLCYLLIAFVVTSMLSHLMYILKYCMLITAWWGISNISIREE